MSQQATRSSPVENPIISEDEEVSVIEEDIPQLFPIFKWEFKLKMMWVILVIVEKAQLTRQKVNNIIDFIVSGIEVADTRDSIKELAAGAAPELKQLLTSVDHQKVQGTEMISENGSRLRFCTGAERKRAKEVAQNIIGVAQTTHKILRKALAQIVSDMEANEAKQVVSRAIKDLYRLKNAYVRWGKRSAPIKAVIAPAIRRLNRLKASDNIMASSVRVKLTNTGLALQDVAIANFTWTRRE